MFARVNYNHSIRHTLEYNERKLKLGKAECLLAANFLKDKDKLSQKDELRRFQRLNALHKGAKANTLHISLSFHPSDQLDNAHMTELSKEYMRKIGLDHQPFLVYRHHDTGHPHMHIVSTLIKPDGNRINLRNILSHQSRSCVKELEQEFSLTKFHKQRDALVKEHDRLPPQKVIYGEPHRQKAVERVVDHVIDKYRFSSLSEFNAVLGLYNVKAKPVGHFQELSQAAGLVYHTLDDKGRYIGLPFKSSLFPSQPGIQKLQNQFTLNAQLPYDDLKRLRLSIDWALAGKSLEWDSFTKSLLKEKIHAVPDKGKAGVWQGLNYIDTASRLVVSGEALGERYTALAIKGHLDQNRQLNLGHSLAHDINNTLKSKIS